MPDADIVREYAAAHAEAHGTGGRDRPATGACNPLVRWLRDDGTAAFVQFL